jgi:hypothetical protein
VLQDDGWTLSSGGQLYFRRSTRKNWLCDKRQQQHNNNTTELQRTW